MKLVFVHGWSVTSADTYGELPQVLQSHAPKELDIEIESIYLGEYISFHDEVTMHDVARAFENARLDKLGDEPFACITHSTGGPVIRLWIDLFFQNTLHKLPLTHLIMLAPANHGSALAQLGKSRLGRIKAWTQGMEPGVGVLNWLELGSSDQWRLNRSWLEYSYDEGGFFAFVLSGATVDRNFYDFLNSYLVEKGSDGIIRLCSANLNYGLVSLEQDCDEPPYESEFQGELVRAYPLKYGAYEAAPECAFEILPKTSHTGRRFGIMESVTRRHRTKPVIHAIIEALQVNSHREYEQTSAKMQRRGQQVQKNRYRYVMFIFSVKDSFGNPIEDFDMLLLGGSGYEPDKLPRGFFIDKQKNRLNGNLTYYMNYDKLLKLEGGKLGIRITARPDQGFSRYVPAELRTDLDELKALVRPNQTVMIEVTLQRRISKSTFVVERLEEIERHFKERKSDEEFI